MRRSARFGCGALKNGRGRRHWAAHYPAMGLPCGLEGRLPAGFMLVRRQLGETTIYEARRSLRGGGELADPDGASDGTGAKYSRYLPKCRSIEGLRSRRAAFRVKKSRLPAPTPLSGASDSLRIDSLETSSRLRPQSSHRLLTRRLDHRVDL
jgi:hypothetical protein